MKLEKSDRIISNADYDFIESQNTKLIELVMAQEEVIKRWRELHEKTIFLKNAEIARLKQPWWKRF